MIRSSRPAAASALSQNASAASGRSGCMKLTDPPFATVSIRISLSIRRISGEALRALILIADMMAGPSEKQFLKSRFALGHCAGPLARA